MQELTRRQFLAFLGAGTAAAACGAISPYSSVAALGGFILPFTPGVHAFNDLRRSAPAAKSAGRIGRQMMKSESMPGRGRR